MNTYNRSHLWSRRLLKTPTHGGHVLMLSSISNDILSCHMFVENPEDDVWVHTGLHGRCWYRLNTANTGARRGTSHAQTLSTVQLATGRTMKDSDTTVYTPKRRN